MIEGCPYGKDWDELVKAVGSYKAYQDYLESGGQVRSVDDVLDKLILRGEIAEESDELNTKNVFEMSEDELMQDMAQKIPGFERIYDPIDLSEVAVGNSKANATVDYIVKNLSDRLNVPYQMVSQEEANKIINDAGETYTGEAGFYVGGIVYFIKDKLNTEVAFHEFSHPFVRAIGVENNKLFNKLYDDLASTEEGSQLIQGVKELHPGMDPESKYFKEEVLVRALTKASVSKQKKKTLSEKFMKVINDILYAIKQIFRKTAPNKEVAKAIKISNLNVDTSIDQLADIFTEADIEFNLDAVSEKDVVAFMAENRKEVEDVINKGQTDEGAQAIKESINSIYNVLNNHAERLKANKNLSEMLYILESNYGESELENIRKNISAYQTVITNQFNNTIENLKDTQERATAFVNTLFSIKAMSEKMLLHMQEMSRRKNEPDKVKKFYYYQQLINDWKVTTKKVRDSFTNAGEVTGPMLELVGDIDTMLGTAESLVGKVNVEGSSELLERVLEPLSKEVDRYYDEIISELKKKGAPQYLVDKYTREYDGAKLDKKTLESWLRGEQGDTNALSAWVESFMNIQDPVIFGLASYVNENIMDVMSTVQKKYNAQTQDLKKLLDQAGYNPNNPKGLASKVIYTELEGMMGKDGKFTERQRKAFIHHVKGYEVEINRKNNQIKDAELAAKESGDNTEVDKLYVERNNMMTDFYRDYTDEVYERDQLFQKDELGQKAYIQRWRILQKIQNLNGSLKSPSDRLEDWYRDELSVYWKEYQELYSLAYSNGKMKQGEDRDVSVRLREHREATRKYFEWVPRKGMFQGALKAYEQRILDTNPTIKYGDSQFNKLRESWINNNTRVKIKAEFYQRRQEILDEIAAIKAKLPKDVQAQLKSDELYKELSDQISAYRDEDGQPEGMSMTPAKLARIKELEIELEENKDDLANLQGLTKREQDYIDTFDDEVAKHNFTGKGENPMDDDDRYNKYKQLKQKSDDLGLTDAEANRLRNLYKQLKGLSNKTATDQYITIVNNFLRPNSELKTPLADYVKEKFNISEFDKNTIGQLEDYDTVEAMMKLSPEFEEWYDKNHIRTEYFSEREQDLVYNYKRTAAWNVTQPVESKYLETTDILDESGKVIETIPGVPIIDYWRQKIKDEYKNTKVTMKEALDKGDLSLATVDHKGKWLPKPNSKYRNEEYYNIKNRDKNQFELLNKLLYYHLDNQEGLGHTAKLGTFMPRYRKSNYEVIATQGKDKLTAWAKNVKSTFAKAKDDLEDGYNPDIDLTFVNLDMFDNEISGIPISGKFDLDLDETSDDVLLGMMRYMQSAERHKKLVEISPEVRALQKVVNSEDGATKDMKKASKSDFINKGITRYATRKGVTVRAQAINAFIEREFEGKTQAGALADMTGVNKAANFLLGVSSMSFFALDIASALKNSFGARFQAMIESSGGTAITPTSLGKGTIWGNMTAAEVSFQIYKFGPKSLNVQLYEAFDPDQKFLDSRKGKFAEGVSRTFAKDVMSGSWLTNTREWTQMNATLGLFGGMMYNQTVTQTLNGVEKEIAYIDAWEVKDGQLTVKEGIDKEWDMGGTKFKQMRAKVQSTNRRLNGAYAQFDRSMGERYLLFRMITFLKRHFVRMFQNRWGYRGSFMNPEARWDVGANEMQIGYYTQALSTIVNNLKTGGRDLKYMTKREKIAMKKLATELGLVMIAGLLISLLFSYDEDDEDRFAKLRAQSGAIPLPFVRSEPGVKFDLSGYMSNHLLFLSKATLNENTSFIPWPGYGLDDYRKILDFDSVAFGSTLTNYVKMLDAGVAMLDSDPSGYYKRSVGPYSWQDEGSPKILNFFLKSVGFTGGQIDPGNRLKNLESEQNRT